MQMIRLHVESQHPLQPFLLWKNKLDIVWQHFSFLIQNYALRSPGIYKIRICPSVYIQ